MGVNMKTFYLNLVRSPIISTYGGHAYGLIGAGDKSEGGSLVDFKPKVISKVG
jgi:hypothetical protein